MDGTPIREFKNLETKGVPFPKNQPMRIYSSLWNAEDWATRGGLVKTDWSKAPFTASYRNFNALTSSSTGQSLDATGAGQDPLGAKVNLFYISMHRHDNYKVFFFIVLIFQKLSFNDTEYIQIESIISVIEYMKCNKLINCD